MKKLKVVTIVGTRPEIIRLSCVLKKLDQYCAHTFIHTGQNYDYELNEIFFHDLDLRQPDHFLTTGDAGISAAETIGNIIIAVDKLLADIQPQALLVLGDTNSCLSLLPAKRRKIPTFHMEAGNRCFDQRVPEEINRRLVDHMADVNLTYSRIAREYLLREGLPPDLTITTGSPLMEVFQTYRSAIADSDVLQRHQLKEYEFFLVSAHREEHIEPNEQFTALIGLLDTLATEYRLPIIVSTHPRTRQRIEKAQISLHPLVQLLKPLGYCDYTQLQLHARAVLSDSGTISEEASIMNFPALNIRQTHERLEAMEEGAVMMTGLNIERVMQCLAILQNQPRAEKRLCRLVDDYSAKNVADKVVRIVHSYTDYINRVVWKKY